MRESICALAYQKAVDAIDGTEKVYFKHGCWNPYELKPTEEVKKRIMNSGYGEMWTGRMGCFMYAIPAVRICGKPQFS